MSLEHQLEIRVRYHETDGQGRVHHGQYINYFERGRVEFLRAQGHSYREFEESGLLLVVTEMHLQYLDGAVFDDLLQLTTRVTRARGVRIDHEYEILRIDPETQKAASPIVRATSTIACVDRQGKVRRLPEYFRKISV